MDVSIAKLLDDVIRGIATQGWTQIADVGARIVVAPFSGQYKWWTISDNGGELNVARVNDLDSLVSVPYEQHLGRVDGGTVGWWVYQVLTGHPRDYAERLPEFLCAALPGECGVRGCMLCSDAPRDARVSA